jgi:hypothetical protein
MGINPPTLRVENVDEKIPVVDPLKSFPAARSHSANSVRVNGGWDCAQFLTHVASGVGDQIGNEVGFESHHNSPLA